MQTVEVSKSRQDKLYKIFSVLSARYCNPNCPAFATCDAKLFVDGYHRPSTIKACKKRIKQFVEGGK